MSQRRSIWPFEAGCGPKVQVFIRYQDRVGYHIPFARISNAIRSCASLSDASIARICNLAPLRALGIRIVIIRSLLLLIARQTAFIARCAWCGVVTLVEARCWCCRVTRC